MVGFRLLAIIARRKQPQPAAALPLYFRNFANRSQAVRGRLIGLVSVASPLVGDVHHSFPQAAARSRVDV